MVGISWAVMICAHGAEYHVSDNGGLQQSFALILLHRCLQGTFTNHNQVAVALVVASASCFVTCGGICFLLF
jgi:hypothetical protein